MQHSMSSFSWSSNGRVDRVFKGQQKQGVPQQRSTGTTYSSKQDLGGMFGGCQAAQ